MKVKGSNNFVWLSLILILSISSMANACGTTEPVGGGSPLMRLIIENQTDQALIITVNDYPVGEVGPGGQIIREDADVDLVNYLIEARDTQGETIFSETYTFKTNDKYHLQMVEERVYKAVIPPLQNK